MPIKDLINKIKWDKREDASLYRLWYLDFGKLKSVDYSSILRLEGNFMIINKEGEEIEVPLHRIRRVTKAGVFVWQR